MSVGKFVQRVQREPFHCICQAKLVCSHFYGQYNPSVDKQKHANEFTMPNFANILQYLPKKTAWFYITRLTRDLATATVKYQ